MDGFSIVIPTYNRAELLRKALVSIQNLRIPEGCNAEILVIDNNSTDHTSSVASQSHNEGPLLVRHVIEKKQGLNHGRNRGLAEARFEHLVYLDDDMTVDPEWLIGYMKAHDRFSPAAVVGPVEPLYEQPPGEWVTERMLRSVSSAYSQKGEYIILIPPEQGHELPGCNFAVCREVAIKIGGFHPALDRSSCGMLAGGDSEFGERLARNGHRIAYSPDCKIHHLVSSHKLSKQGLRARWHGLGATNRAMEKLRGDEKPLIGRSSRLHLSLRMVNLFGRSLYFSVLGDISASFRWELEALRLKGYLFDSPEGLQGLPRESLKEPLN